MLHVSVLGPLEVRRDGDLVTVPGGRTSALLVRLALDAGRLVRTDRLLEDLWAEDAVHTRRNTLQSKVARLRRALADPGAVVRVEGGYLLAVERATVDALEVERGAEAASRLLAAGDDRGAAELCASALAGLPGELLPAVSGDWVEPHRARLEEVRTTLLETWSTAQLRLGELGAVIGELERALETRPFQEGLWELLITALYRSGRQADALSAYQRVRAELADQLGLDPGPELQALERRILAHDESLAAARPGRMPAGDGPAGNLPSLGAELVGRDEEIDAVLRLVARHRLVEVVGPGGIGKTALAIEAGRRLEASPPHGDAGVWLVRLESSTTPGEVVDAVVAALRVTGGEAALLERLRVRPAVLVLDNCEHVVDAAAELAERLLDAAPHLRLLCTSQVPLGVDGETVLELGPLGLDHAVELFTLRASAQRATTGDAGGAVEDLCRSLDGLPLAIELAAARTRTLSVAEISRRLDDRFAVLADPTSRRPERRRALRSTIAWSYDLLFPDDQRGLWALAAFTDGAPLDAVEHVLGALDVPASATIDVLGRLAARSLVIAEDGPGGSVRYRLLESIRAFALEAMAAAGMADRALASHAAWYAGVAVSSTAGVRGAHQAEHLDLVRVERANIDAALTWSTAHDPSLALAIVNGFGWAWVVLGDSRGAERLLAALDVAGEAAPARDRATALLLAGWIEASTGHIERARSHVTAASTLADDVADDELRARAGYHLAYVVSHEGHWQWATELTERSRTLYDGLDRPWDQAANALFAARAAISAGDDERAVEARDRVDRWLGTVDDPWLHVRRDAMLGELARLQHRFDDAVHHIGRAATTSLRLGFQQTEAYQVSSLGRAQCQAGDPVAGAATLRLAIAKAEAIGDVRLAALVRVHLGRVLRSLGRTAEARAELEVASRWHREAGGGEQAALGECLLAALDAADGVAGAGDRLAVILAAGRDRGDAPVEVMALDALARLAAGAGDTVTARDLAAEADRRMVEASHFITELDRTDARAGTEVGAIEEATSPGAQSATAAKASSSLGMSGPKGE